MTNPVTKTVEEKNLIESLHYLKVNNLIKPSKASPNFETVKEAEDYMKEEIVSAIKEKTNIIKQDITELQKKGINLHLEGIRLLEIPLKTKVWLSTLSKKDLENIFNILDEVSKIIIPLKTN